MEGKLSLNRSIYEELEKYRMVLRNLESTHSPVPMSCIHDSCKREEQMKICLQNQSIYNLMRVCGLENQE